MASHEPNSQPPGGTKVFFGRSSYREHLRIGEILRKETVGGVLLLIATVAALIWANSPASESYFAIRDFSFGYEPWHLNLSVGAWAADGLLAIFFILVGLELKKEFVAGVLRQISKSIVAVAAAFGGVSIPALIFVGVQLATGSDGIRGWAIPTATDIAFALAVLAVISSHLPTALRIFLLTLAVVDDLIAITIIALFYSEDVNPLMLGLTLIPLAAFTLLVQRGQRFFGARRWPFWVFLAPLAVAVWILMHASGVHATVAGVLLGFAVPVLRRDPSGGTLPHSEDKPGLAEIFEHRFRPISTGFAVPLFAFFSAGVAFGGLDGLGRALTDPVAVGIVAALVLGKPIGVLLTTWVLTFFTKATLDRSVKWVDLTGIGILAGIGFTVSLLVNDLSFGLGSAHHEDAKIAILTASVLAAVLASILLTIRNRHYAVLEKAERVDADNDGIPDVFQQEDGQQGR